MAKYSRHFGAISTRYITPEEIASIPVLYEIRRKWNLITVKPNPDAQDWQNIGLLGYPVNVAQSAWRLFYMERIGVDSTRMISLFKPGNWTEGCLRALCYAGRFMDEEPRWEHNVPEERCTCGVYATWNEWIVMQYVENPKELTYRNRDIVLAKVAPKAPYIPAEEGWRASGAQIMELYTFECDSEEKKKNIEEYAYPLGIPITDLGEKTVPKLRLKK